MHCNRLTTILLFSCLLARGPGCSGGDDSEVVHDDSHHRKPEHVVCQLLQGVFKEKKKAYINVDRLLLVSASEYFVLAMLMTTLNSDAQPA